MRNLSIVLALTGIFVAVFTTKSYSDDVVFTISEGAGGLGTFDLFVDVSGGNTFGLAGYEFFFNDIDSIVNLSPRNVFDPPAVSATGFTLLTSADNDPNLVGVQNSTAAASIIYGFGQTAGAFGVGVVNPIPASAAWDAHLLLASGTYSGDPQEIADSISGDFGPGIVNLWATDDGTGASTQPDGIEVINEIIPEPSSLILLGLGLATFVGFGRRRS